MALNKTFTQENGVTTSYHKVTRVTISSRNDETLDMGVEMTSYLDENYREKNTPITSMYYNFDITDEEEQSTSARKLAYTKIKTLAEWSDAVDC